MVSQKGLNAMELGSYEYDIWNQNTHLSVDLKAETLAADIVIDLS
jgi:hypothetical protein